MTVMVLKIKVIFLAILCSVLFLNNLSAQQEPLIITVQKSLPSIVTVNAQNTHLYRSPGSKKGYDKNLARFFSLRKLQTMRYERTGAGVIIDPAGIIVVNAHTIYKANKVAVVFNDQTKASAQVVWMAEGYDFAFLRIVPPFPLKAISFTDSNAVAIGDDIINVGHSQLLNETISGGRVIGLGQSSSKRQSGIEDTYLIQTDIGLYKGDSGGPLLDRKGRLIGLMVAKESKKNNSTFAIPSNKIIEQYNQYLKENNQ